MSSRWLWIAGGAVVVGAAVVTALLLGGGEAPAEGGGTTGAGAAAATATATAAGTGGEADAVLVPEGQPFWRGHPDGPPHPFGNADTHPMRLIRVSAFRIDRREVTAADYDRCAAAKGCAARDCGEATAPEATPGAPATCVSWFDATAYCAWVAGRLPTEAEWEKAARSRDGRKYPWGGEAPTCERALFNECGNESADPVGSHPAGASPYGVEDLAGNVAEWVADWYDGAYYRDSPETDPTGPAEGEAKVVRGGSWATGSRLLMTGYRSFAPPLERREDLGFRCAWPVR